MLKNNTAKLEKQLLGPPPKQINSYEFDSARISMSSDSLDFKSCLDEPLPINMDSHRSLNDSPLAGDLKRLDDELTRI